MSNFNPEELNLSESALTHFKEMLDLSKKKFSQYSNIKWFCNNAEKLPFKNNTFDYYTISFGIRNVENINMTADELEDQLKDKLQKLLGNN